MPELERPTGEAPSANRERIHILNDPEGQVPGWLKVGLGLATAIPIGIVLFDLLNGSEGVDWSLAAPAALALAGIGAAHLGLDKFFDKRCYITLDGHTLDWRYGAFNTETLDLREAGAIRVGLMAVEIAKPDGQVAKLKLDFLGYRDVRRVKAWLTDYDAQRT